MWSAELSALSMALQVPPVLLLIEGPGSTGLLRWPPSEGHFAIPNNKVQILLCQSPEARLKGALHRVCSTRCHSPHPPPLALRATSITGMSFPLRRAATSWLGSAPGQVQPQPPAPARPASPPLLARLACYS